MHPAGHRAQGIVVETGHVAGVDAAVGQHAVPALPDSRRAHGNWIEPAGAFPMQQHAVEDVGLARLGQRVAKVWCPREAGGDLEATSLTDE